MSSVVDSYSESNYAVDTVFGVSYPKYGQSFTANGSILDSAEFYLKTTGSSTGNVTATIYAHDGGTFGSTGLPTGTALATSDTFDVSALTTSNALITLTFTGANRITLTNATHYFVILEGTTAGNFIYIGIDNTSPTAAGNLARDDGTGWSTTSNDVIFYVYGDVSFTSPFPTFFR